MTRATLKIRTSKNLHDNIIQESYGTKLYCGKGPTICLIYKAGQKA